MPTDYKRKTDRGMASREIYDLAAEEVTLRHKSLREAASSYNLNHTSLYRYIKKKSAYEADETVGAPTVGYPEKTVFTASEEKILCEESALYPAFSTSDERPPANSICHDSRTPSPSVLNLPATPPQIDYETEDVSKNPVVDNSDKNSPNLATGIIPEASTSRATLSTKVAVSFSPERLRPLSKAPPRKGTQTNRRKVKSAVLTDTPVKDELAAIEAARTVKKKIG
ncbi:hypothetical protein SFRURICE_016338 [Spodoptera frugiperda]|nr:hypothetical protein SFRURICE_016338 [Spodoptera frugiperda]